MSVMKNWRVTYYIDNEDQYEGRKPHNYIYEDLDSMVEADTAAEAIALALDYLADQVRANSDYRDIDTENGEIVIRDEDGTVVECYYGFLANAEEE